MKQLSIFEEESTVTSSLSKINLKNPSLLRDLPFDDIYEVSRKEASRKKPIFFIHKYFARRTTCNFRLMLLSLLLPYNESVWDNFYKSHSLKPNESLTILDPFMGGGTTVFEALRLGANVIGNDLQPLSKFVTTGEVKPAPVKKIKQALKDLESTVGKKIKSYYETTCPECSQTADVMYNFHVKQSKANSSCGIHDLYSSFLLSSKKGTYTMVCPDCLEVYKSDFSEGQACCPKCNYVIKSPDDGFVTRGKFTCPDCDETDHVRNYKDDSLYPFKTKLIAQEYYCPHCKAHDYKSVSKDDIDLFDRAEQDFESLQDELPIPDQEIPNGYNTKQIINHGYKYFKDLFNKRQLLCLGLLLKEIDSIEDDEVKFWLLLAFSASLEMNNSFCRYQHNAFKICNIFFNHAYVPITMPVENNVWGTKLGTGTFLKSVNKLLTGKDFNDNIYDISVENGKSGKIFTSEKVNAHPVNCLSEVTGTSPLLTNQDSRDLSFIPDKSVDIILTDPPYGSNVMYSELIDFFHSWIYKTTLGKTIGFNTPLSPKVEEIIVNSARNQGYDDYTNGLAKVFEESNRVLKDEGFLAFTFHDSELQGWFSVIESIEKANFELIAAYPIHSESRTGAHTSSKESIAFDIFLICKKRTGTQTLEKINLEDIEQISISKTEEFVQRLDNISAEVTIPDIENIFISQFFVHVFKYQDQIILGNDKIKNRLKQTVKELDDLFRDYNIVNKRSGWWSELHGRKYMESDIQSKIIDR